MIVMTVDSLISIPTFWNYLALQPTLGHCSKELPHNQINHFIDYLFNLKVTKIFINRLGP